MSAGNPLAYYFVGNQAEATAISGAKGIFTGGDVSPMTKHLKKLTALTVTAAAVPLVLILCDYVMVYPLIDQSITDQQDMDNTLYSLPRYTDGAGLQMIAVLNQAQVGTCTFFVTYTNQAGTSGRVTPTITCNANTSTGTLITSAKATSGTSGPFITLQAGDTGVRSVQSVTIVSSDAGLFNLVLVKPLATHTIRTIDAPAERDYLVDFPSLPRIYDGAHLNFLACPNGSLAAAPIHGDIEVVWS